MLSWVPLGTAQMSHKWTGGPSSLQDLTVGGSVRTGNSWLPGFSPRLYEPEGCAVNLCSPTQEQPCSAGLFLAYWRLCKDREIFVFMRRDLPWLLCKHHVTDTCLGSLSGAASFADWFSHPWYYFFALWVMDGTIVCMAFWVLTACAVFSVSAHIN